MKLLVATKNQEKLNIAQRLYRAIDPSIMLFGLADSGLSGEIVEIGSIEQRAEQKARYYCDKAKSQLSEIPWDGVLGIDDGIDVGDGIIRANSQETTDAILAEQAAKPGDTIRMARASSTIWFNNGKNYAITTYSPYIFLGNPKGIVRKEGVYPLTQVFAPLGQDQTLAEMSEAETTAYYLQYHRREIEELLKSYKS